MSVLQGQNSNIFIKQSKTTEMSVQFSICLSESPLTKADS